MARLKRLLPLLFALAIAANLFELASLTVLHWNGDVGYNLVHTGAPFVYRAAEVYGPARPAGFRAGDRFDIREGFRAQGYANPIAGKPYRVVAHRGNRIIDRTIVPETRP